MLSWISFDTDISLHNCNDGQHCSMFITRCYVVFVGMQTTLNPLGEVVKWVFDDKCFQKTHG